MRTSFKEKVIAGIVIAVILTPIMLISKSCNAQNGTISGNVFWKYNSFIGNKPDAGADVFVNPIDTNRSMLKTQSDVQGNYKFEHVPVGKYMVLIVSNNTRFEIPSLYMGYEGLMIQKYLGFDLRIINNSLYDSVIVYDTLFRRASRERMKAFAIKKWEKNLAESKKAYSEALHRLLIQIPMAKRISQLLPTIYLFKKFEVREIEISADENQTIITDFNITDF